MVDSINNNRIGFHYFNDTLHYREKDLQAWLPQLESLGAKWLVIKSESQRAIPETFVRALIKADIQPIIHMPLSLSAPLPPLDLSPILKAYASWGVEHIVFFDEPNMHESWGGNSWSQQQNLVERFLDIYLPLALQAMQDGLRPGFPPLRRGGDYWDTAFLRAALQGIKQRKQDVLLEKIFLSANATTNGYPVHWGAGGPERWPGARPYFTQTGEEDQKGFYSFDWYTAISEAVLNQKLPIALIRSGSIASDPEQHAAENLEIAQTLINPDHSNNPIPEHVFTCNFWVLAAGPESTSANDAWYRKDGTLSDAVKALKALHAANRPKKTRKHISSDDEETQPISILENNLGEVPIPTPTKHLPEHKQAIGVNENSINHNGHSPEISQPKAFFKQDTMHANNGSFEHYLLLPTYEWGIADWHLEVIQPYVKKHLPTIGFSIEEALCAQIVTVVGGAQSFPSDVIAMLERNGCQVNQIQGTGTSIASQLATL